MTEKNVRKWLDALKSGEYSQTQGALRDENGFCCLGVACDISGLGSWEGSDEEGWHYVVREDLTAWDSVLPAPVQNWLRLSSRLGHYDAPEPEYDPCESLAEENDKGRTFREIAAIIESRPKGLFKDAN